MSFQNKRVEVMKAKQTKLPLLGALTSVSLVVFAYMCFFYAPEDSVQGVVQRVFYPHVASAWVASIAFLVVFLVSIRFLVTRDLKWDEWAAASAEIGLLFTSATLVLGMIWGKAVWGVYWTWDPRLTSVLVLWLLYLGYIALRFYVVEPMRRARYAAVLGIVSFIDVPIIYVSVKLWRTLHPQQIIITDDGPQLPTAMLITVLFGVFAFTVLYIYLARLRAQVLRLADQSHRRNAA
ncbi:MAG: cytochrome C assembly protein [Actinobacteria bacterium]|uniref:Unannotated protein n=1 Tax=freshwater metagenome TaxID=449393 RepID=A0A6J5ZKL0_9ZZZZ|nr:cytochrome C assembly protein [Actinomycetota bacterium]